jgi:hypothetical protein
MDPDYILAGVGAILAGLLFFALTFVAGLVLNNHLVVLASVAGVGAAFLGYQLQLLKQGWPATGAVLISLVLGVAALALLI